MCTEHQILKQIVTEDLKVGMYIQKLGGSWMQHPFLKNSFLITKQEQINKIHEAGIKTVWIDETKGKALEVEKSPKVEAETETPPPPESTETPEKAKTSNNSPMDLEVERAKKLCSEAKDQVEGLFNDVRMGKAIDPKETLPLVNEISDAVSRNSAAILSVARLKTHDDYTYMHSVAVCALMVALAKQLNLDEEQTRLAGVGGLMHDLGKAFMPLEVLNKPGKLTDKEFEIMKKHPLVGAKVIKEGGAEPEVVDIALHHHEKVNGMGYPHRLKSEEISLLTKMSAVCDVYDAVTSIRPYKEPWGPANSIREMAKWEGHFDKQVFNAFVRSIGIYPTGSLVRLASQRLAVVVEPNDESLLTPIVKIFFSLKSKEPIKLETLDLAARGCKDKIEGPEDASKWKFNNLESLWQ